MKNPGIYILTCSVNGKQYVGRDSCLPKRFKRHLSGREFKCRLIHNAVNKYGSKSFEVEIILYPGISFEALCSVEEWYIKKLGTLSPEGYNLSDRGCGPASGDRNSSRRPEVREKLRGIALERVRSGTHNFLGMGGENHPNKSDEYRAFMSEIALERIKNGTHNLPDSRYDSLRFWKYRLTMKARRRELYRIYAALLMSRSVLLEYRHRQLQREGFFDKDIPDTSGAIQTELF